MDQPTFSDLEYPGKKRKTRRELFLERMDGLIPWQLLGGGLSVPNCELFGGKSCYKESSFLDRFSRVESQSHRAIS